MREFCDSKNAPMICSKNAIDSAYQDQGFVLK